MAESSFKPRSTARLGVGPLRAQLRAGYQRMPGHTHQANFRTPQYAAVYLVTGHGHFVDSLGQRHDLQPGCLFQRHPNQVHHVTTEDAAWYFLAVPAATVDLMRITGLPTVDHAVIQPGLDRGLMRRCDQLIDRLRDAPPTHLMACQCALQQLIVDLHLRALERHDGGRDHAFVTRACAALAASCDGRASLAQVAQRLGMGYAAFRKRFTQQLGIAPGAYRIRQRIERAQALLGDHSVSIDSIADQLGYPDIFAFSTQFKRHTGRSPTHFRRELA